LVRPQLYSTLEQHIDHIILQVLPSLAPSLPPIHTRIIVLGAEVILLALQCHCTIKLFTIPRWRERYLPWVCGLAVNLLILGASIAEELGTLFLEIFANIIAALIVGCLIADEVGN
jgi:hypothetical protein